MNQDFINAALALDQLSIHHEIEFRPDEAHAFAESCDAHPITPSELDTLLTDIDNLIPRQNWGITNFKPNPNNGQMFHLYKIGKEYSRIVYVICVKSYAAKANWDSIEKSIIRLGKNAGADEAWAIKDDDDVLTVRLWWD